MQELNLTTNCPNFRTGSLELKFNSGLRVILLFRAGVVRQTI